MLVVGPGAMGCLLGGLLAEAGREVVLLGRDPARAAQVTAEGVTLEGPGEAPARRLRVTGAASPQGLTPALVLLCVKAPDTADAVEPLRDLPGAPTVAVVQNGLDRPAEVAARLGDPARVVGVLTTEGATRVAPAHVRHAGRGTTVVGALVAEGAARAAEVAATLRAAGLAVEVTADLGRATWEKLLVNAAINALTALLGCPNGALLESPAARALADAAALEVAAVARARGVAGAWDPEAARTRWQAVARATAGNASSTLQDLRQGRKTEVCAINGAVARAGHEHGVSAYVNEVLAQLVEAREELARRA